MALLQTSWVACLAWVAWLAWACRRWVACCRLGCSAVAPQGCLMVVVVVLLVVAAWLAC
jgi:hypothetical protein